MRTILIFLLTALIITLLSLIVWATTRENIASSVHKLLSMPWGLVTLVDLYAGLFVISLWIVVFERRWWVAAVWILLMIGLGNLASLGYILVQIWRNETVQGALTSPKHHTPPSNPSH